MADYQLRPMPILQSGMAPTVFDFGLFGGYIELPPLPLYTWTTHPAPAPERYTRMSAARNCLPSSCRRA